MGSDDQSFDDDDLDDLDDLQQVTILLTSATYKLFVSNHAPAISYFTVLDLYVVGLYLLQVEI